MPGFAPAFELTAAALASRGIEIHERLIAIDASREIHTTYLVDRYKQ